MRNEVWRVGLGKASACKLGHQLGDGIENVVANQRLLIEQAGVFNESLKGLAVLAGGVFALSWSAPLRLCNTLSVSAMSRNTARKKAA